MNIFKDVKKNEYGFYELKNKPSNEELQEYYSNKYYQENKSNYNKFYSENEIINIKNKLQRRYELIKENELKNKTFLDIGCGEGWALDYFHMKGWSITGLDYSIIGIQNHNPSIEKYVIPGDLVENLEALLNLEKTFDIILLDNVLEHVLDPKALLLNIHKLLNSNGVLMVEVPNDFSLLQQQLIKKGKIEKAFWVVNPDHISYFNKEGLNKICEEAGFKIGKILSDFPIDFNLFNDDTNYATNRSVGKACHQSRVDLENFLHFVSSEKLNELYQVLADMGLGRNIFGLYNKDNINY